MISEFMKGFTQAAKETPKGYFAPAIAIWRVLFCVTESIMKHPNHPKIT